MLIGASLISLAIFACQTDTGGDSSSQELPVGTFSPPTDSKPLSQVIQEMEYSGRPITPPKKLPEFVLRDQANQNYGSDNLVGKTALISFAYTNCPDVCPALFGEFVSIRRELSKELNKELELVIISVDPERDTPERLNLLTSQVGGEWRFLQGSRSELEEVWAKFKVAVIKEGDLVSHSGVTYLVTTDANMTVNFPSFATASHFIRDVQPLLETAVANSDSLSVSDAWIRPNVDPTAIYLSVVNTGDSNITLIGASADWAGRLSIHETRDRDGLMAMSPIDQLTVPKKGSVTMAPGGVHIMVQDIWSEISEGQVLPVYLHLKEGGSIKVSAEVKAP